VLWNEYTPESLGSFTPLIHKSHGALTFVANVLQQFIGDVLYCQSDESRGFMTDRLCLAVQPLCPIHKFNVVSTVQRRNVSRGGRGRGSMPLPSRGFGGAERPRV
jgi:hypothetical protein